MVVHLMLFILAVTQHIKTCASEQVSCGEQLVVDGSKFIIGHQFDELSSYQYYIPDITFTFNGTYDYIQFNPCNNITSTDIVLNIDVRIYDQNFNKILSTTGYYANKSNDNWYGNEACKSTNIFTTELQKDTLYNVIIATSVYDTEYILQIDISCICNYKCASQKQISCDDSLKIYGDQFDSVTSHYLNAHIYSTNLYYFTNITFTYNGEFDSIIFDTCHNETTLAVGIILADENLNVIERISPEYYGCSLLEILKLQPNKLYYLLLTSKILQRDKIVNLNVKCHCDCNYIIKQNKI
eukprot:473158_1